MNEEEAKRRNSVTCSSVMETKFSHKREFPFPKFRVLRPAPNHTSLSQRFCLKSLEKKKRLLKKRFRGLTEKWKFQVQKLSEGQHMTKQFLVHVVKEGETLTSISKWYGVSIHAIAAANINIVDVDLVLEGQLLKIPFSGAEESQMGRTGKSWVPRIDAHERCQSSLDGHKNYKILIMLSSHYLIYAKRTGYFLVMVPLIAFCIRCIVGAFHNRVADDLKRQALNESEAHHHRSRSMRWKSALSDIREPDVLGAESRSHSVDPSEDQSQVPFEDMSHAYTKLEPAYQKFLLECGMSKWGYWRGGSPE